MGGGRVTHFYKYTLYGDVLPKLVVFSQEILTHGSASQREKTLDMGPFSKMFKIVSKVSKMFPKSVKNWPTF